MPAQPSRLTRIERRLRALQQQSANLLIDRRILRLRLRTLDLELKNLQEIESSLRSVYAAEHAALFPRCQERSQERAAEQAAPLPAHGVRPSDEGAQDQEARIERILSGAMESSGRKR